MFISKKTILLLGTALVVLGGCASTRPNLEIAATQERLATAYKDKDTVDRGQADLTSADTALRAAQEDWRRGHKEKTTHQLAMARTSIDLADTRGLQAKTERETAALREQAALSAKQAQLTGKQMQLASTKSELASAQGNLADRDQQLRMAQAQLKDYDLQVNALGSTLVLRDVVFETGKSVLRAGAANRLQPMINYLQVSPQTRVRIEGHTDNVGSLAFNQTLSLDRADAVKSALTNGGIDGSRIETVGSGYSKPVGSNSTVSGRESNRRVEITLLK